jgi:ectoine hydroxylase-related dioxygenase (phytanoyl-CoA dioxygenase family)
MNKNISFFNQNGYLVIKNIINKNVIDQIQESIYLRASNYIPKLKKIYDKNFYKKDFHKALLEFRLKNPSGFGSFYDSMQKNILIYKILCTPALIKIVSKIMKKDLKQISFNGENIRMDAPYDKKNSLGWHQDRAYYFQNRDGNKGLVCWLPLIDISAKIGPLKVCSKSHELGLILTKKKKFNKKGYSDQFEIKSSLVKNYKIISPLIRTTDVLLINKNTIHASGKNISDLFRFSMQARFHDLSDQDYLSFNYKLNYNSYDINRMKNKNIDVSDIQF